MTKFKESMFLSKGIIELQQNFLDIKFTILFKRRRTYDGI